MSVRLGTRPSGDGCSLFRTSCAMFDRTVVAGAEVGETVGREHGLGRVSAFLERVAEGPAALVLDGEAGIGKTELWRAGVAGAGGRGYEVLEARPAEAESRLSFAGLADLLA